MTKQSSTPVKAASFGSGVTGAVLFGALIGATSAVARSIRRTRSGEVVRDNLLRDMAREAGTTAAAAGVGVTAAATLTVGPFLSALGVAVATVGTKYALDSLFPPAPARVAAIPAAKPAKAEKTAKAAPAKRPSAKKATAKKTAATKTAAVKAKAKPAADKPATTDKA